VVHKKVRAEHNSHIDISQLTLSLDRRRSGPDRGPLGGQERALQARQRYQGGLHGRH